MVPKEEPQGLRVLDLLGVFYREGSTLMVADEFEGTLNVAEHLKKIEGRRVRILAHHAPDTPDKNRWGAGSCLMEPSKWCSFGHHLNPHELFNVEASGVLFVGDKWGVCQEDDNRVDISEEALIGHRSRVLVLAFPEIDEIKLKVDSVTNTDNLEDHNLEELQDRLEQVRDYLLEIQTLKNNLDV